MTNWKSKLFGDNRFNLYGWVAAGLVVIIASLWFVVRAIQAGAFQSPVSLLLGAIYFVLLGHFGIALQNYCARVAKKLESSDKGDEGTP